MQNDSALLCRKPILVNCGSRWGHLRCTPPYYVSKFSYFYILFSEVTISGIGTPSSRFAPPATGNPGSATVHHNGTQSDTPTDRPTHGHRFRACDHINAACLLCATKKPKASLGGVAASLGMFGWAGCTQLRCTFRLSMVHKPI